MGHKPFFQQRKLNQCAHCPSRFCGSTFSVDGHLYFICPICWFLLQCLRHEAAKMGIRL